MVAIIFWNSIFPASVKKWLIVLKNARKKIKSFTSDIANKQN